MINDKDPRAPEWRRKLAQINAEHPECRDISQRFYNQLPFHTQAFETYHHLICYRGAKALTGNDLAEAMGWNAPNFCGNIAGRR